MNIIEKLFKRKSKVEETRETKPSEIQEDKDEIAAVIAAAIAAMNEEEEIVAAITAAICEVLGKGTDEFIVRKIKRTYEMDSVWAHAGRMKLMR